MSRADDLEFAREQVEKLPAELVKARERKNRAESAYLKAQKEWIDNIEEQAAIEGCLAYFRREIKQAEKSGSTGNNPL